MIFSLSAQAQFYPFGSEFKCSREVGDSLAFLDAKVQLKQTFSELMQSGALYNYRLGSSIIKCEEEDSPEFSIVLLEVDDAAFKATTKRWEEDKSTCI